MTRSIPRWNHGAPRGSRLEAVPSTNRHAEFEWVEGTSSNRVIGILLELTQKKDSGTKQRLYQDAPGLSEYPSIIRNEKCLTIDCKMSVPSGFRSRLHLRKGDLTAAGAQMGRIPRGH
jgi:hypothetical protein